MSRTLSVLAMIAIRPKKEQNKKYHVCHLVWPWLPSGQKKRKNENVMHTVWSGRGHHCKKKGNTKNVTHAVWSGHGCHWAKIRGKIKISRTPSGLAMAVISKKKETRKISCILSGLAVVAIGPKQLEKQDMSRTSSG